MKTVSFTKNALDPNREIILFGGGVYGELTERVIRKLYGGKVSEIVDNKTRELPWTNIPVIRTSDLCKIHNADIIICAAGSFENVLNDILLNSDASCKVFDAIEILNDLKDGISHQRISANSHYVYGNLNLSDLIDKYEFYAGVDNGYEKKLYLPYCVLCITTKCSLRCKDCAAFVTEYKKQQEYNLTDIQKTFGKLLDTIDGIQELELMGGEPFLHKDFNSILKWCLKQKKISAVKIITNGTIMPNKETWDLLADNKLKIVVDDYGELSKCYKEIVLYAKKMVSDVKSKSFRPGIK